MGNLANFVWNGKKYEIPFLNVSGYIEVRGDSIIVHGSMSGVNVNIANGRVFINNIDIEHYITEHKLPELQKLQQMEREFGLNITDKGKEDAFEREILSKGIQTNLKCPHCGQNSLKSIGGMVNKCGKCGYKKIGGAVA